MNKLLILIVLMASCCESTDIELTIRIDNNSNHAISTFIALPNDVGVAYPDTTLPFNEISMQTAAPGQSNYYDFGFSGEELFSTLPSDTMSVYFFSTDTLNNNTWEEIRENYLVLRRDDLTFEDLEAMDWSIDYP